MGIEKVDEEAYSDAEGVGGKMKSTCEEKLLKIEPMDLKFTFEPSKQISCSLYLSNVTDNLVAFKVLTTNVTDLCVRPNTGIILPQSACGITVKKQAQKKAPADMKCKDKFKIQSVVFTQSATQDIKQMFNKKEGHYVEEQKLPVVYLSTPLPLSPLPKEAYSLLTESRNSNYVEMRELLKIDQQDLKFPFEANKRISCSLKLSNMTENHVAFKVKTTHPKKFFVQPNRGVVLPQSTCDVIVTMIAQKALPEVQSKEKFLIQNAAVSPCTPEKDVDWEMFKDAGLVKEQRLPVVYTPENEAPFADAEGSKEYTSKLDSWGKKDNLDVAKDSDNLDVPQAARVRSYIQRNLRRVSSAFDTILNSLAYSSRRDWIFRNLSSGVHRRLLDEADDGKF